MTTHDVTVGNAGYSVPYATPAPPDTRARGRAGAVIIVGELGLILLGGCFLIGVLAIVEGSGFANPAVPPPMTGPKIVLMVVLYLLAFACFAGAAVMLVLGTRALLRVLRE